MFKIYTILIMMIFMELVLSVPSFAINDKGIEIEADSVELNLATAKADGGYYTVDVPIKINKNSGFIVLRFYAYNHESIELIDWIEGDVIPAPNSANQTPPAKVNGTKNGILVYYDESKSVNNRTSTGTLITLRYKVPADVPPGDLEIKLSLEQVYEEDGDGYTLPEKINSYCTIKNGKISVVEEHICGDVNKDGNVDTLDLFFLARHLGEWVGYTEVETVAADVNEDGEVTSTDLVCLSRHIAGWTGYGELPLSNNE